jgi:MFS family permease
MRIITRTVLILSLISLLADIASEMLYPVIPVYLQEVGFSVIWIGLLESIANFTSGLSKGYFGKKSDEKGRRLPFVKAGYLLSAVSKPLIVLFVYPLWIFLMRTADRLGKGIRTAARDAMLSDEATGATRARVFGFHRAMDTAGAAIGPVLALLFLLFHPGNYKSLFYLAFVPGLVSWILIFLVKEKQRPPVPVQGKNFFSYFRYWHSAGKEFRKAVPGLLLFALFNSSDFFLLLVTKETLGNRSISLAGFTFHADTITIAAYIFYNIVYAALSYPLGALADKFSPLKVIIAGFMLFAIVYGGFGLHPSLPMIFGLFGLYGIFSAATDGVTKAWITNLAGGNNTATAIGFYTSCESICTLLASTLAGLIWSGAGSSFLFYFTAIMAFAAALYIIFIRTRSRYPAGNISC